MIRKIIFRGINQEKKFIYGDLVQDYQNKRYAIIPQIGKEHDYNAFEVLGISIGQNTGLKDKNGKEIYEGDILKSLGKDVCVVRWIKDLACFMLENTNPTEDFDNILFPLHRGYEHREVVGNIFENPEFTQSLE